MPTPTYTALATFTVATPVQIVTFSSINQSFRDLIIVVEGLFETGSGNVLLRFNSDSGSNYPNIYLIGTNASATSQAFTGSFAYGGGFNTTTRGVSVWDIMDYSATDKQKTVINRTGTHADASYAWASRWTNTSAITSVQVWANTKFWTNSTISLYGIIA